MTTREFITKGFNGETRTNACSSVFKDGLNDIYSYGYHYPLLFRVKNANGRTLVIRNITGYSNTTQRHIMWSRDVDAIDIYCGAGFRLVGSNSQILEDLETAQCRHIEGILRQMATKTRKDTFVYHDLERKLANARNNLTALRGE